MRRVLDYRSRKEFFFLDYLPDQFFINLNEKERIKFRQLRENHKLIENTNQKIRHLEEELAIRKEKLKKLNKQIYGTNERHGYHEKMEGGKKALEKHIKRYKFSLSVGFRSPKTKKTTRATPKLYLRIQRSSNEYKNIYLGSESDIRIILKEITQLSWKKPSIEYIKQELVLMYGAYVRYFIWKNNWEDFFNTKHSIDQVKQWAIKMGPELYRW